MSDKRQLLINRGVNARYHPLSLSEYPHKKASDLINWIENCNDDLNNGKGLNIIGNNEASYDLSMLLARAIILSNIYKKFRVIPFASIVNDSDILDRLSDDGFPPIMITCFHPDTLSVDPREYSYLETIIMYKYFDTLTPVFFHINADFVEKDSVEIGDLASPLFTDRLFSINSKLIVGKK